MLDGTGVLVGRRVELDALQAALAGLENRAHGVVQIAGEQGIGKTRLVAELCASAERLRYLVFSGRSAEFEQAEPFGVLVDALDDYLASLDRRELDDLDVELDELASVFPALARLVGDPVATSPDERYRAFQAVRTLLDALSRRRPVVLDARRPSLGRRRVDRAHLVPAATAAAGTGAHGDGVSSRAASDHVSHPSSRRRRESPGSSAWTSIR